MSLPESTCQFGYPTEQVKEILGDDAHRFWNWMRGQTMAVCDAKVWNPETEEYEVACSGIEHGYVVYGHDLERFLLDLPVID